jgi:hypothetical protein
MVLTDRIISKTARLKNNLLNTKYVFFIFSTTFVETFLILRPNEWDMIKICIGFHVKCHLLLSDFNESLTFANICEKFPNIKFHETPHSESRVVPCGETDRRTDMRKLIVAFRSFANAPKNCMLKYATPRFFYVRDYVIVTTNFSKPYVNKWKKNYINSTLSFDNA